MRPQTFDRFTKLVFFLFVLINNKDTKITKVNDGTRCLINIKQINIKIDHKNSSEKSVVG